jgi:hypothetical protein
MHPGQIRQSADMPNEVIVWNRFIADLTKATKTPQIQYADRAHAAVERQHQTRFA